jgi:phosphoglycerate dehydrogenase-like enzyme
MQSRIIDKIKQATMMMKFIVLALAAFSSASAFAPLQHRVSSKTVLHMTAEETHNKGEIKVGVVGMGRIGIVHLEAISKAPGVKCIVVSNPTVSKAEAGKSLEQLTWSNKGLLHDID